MHPRTLQLKSRIKIGGQGFKDKLQELLVELHRRSLKIAGDGSPSDELQLLSSPVSAAAAFQARSRRRRNQLVKVTTRWGRQLEEMVTQGGSRRWSRKNQERRKRNKGPRKGQEKSREKGSFFPEKKTLLDKLLIWSLKFSWLQNIFFFIIIFRQ